MKTNEEAPLNKLYKKIYESFSLLLGSLSLEEIMGNIDLIEEIIKLDFSLKNKIS